MHARDSDSPYRDNAERIRQLATAPPTAGQLWHLNRLKYHGPLPQSKLEAAALLDRLVSERQAHPVAGPRK